MYIYIYTGVILKQKEINIGIGIIYWQKYLYNKKILAYRILANI